MPLEFFTGFEGCGSNEDLWSLFDYIGVPAYRNVLLSSTGGWDNGKCAHLSFGASSFQRSRMGINNVPALTVVLGMHINNFGSNTQGVSTNRHANFITFGSDAGYIALMSRSTGLEVYRNGTLIASGTTALTSALTHIEVKLFSDASAGTVQVKINGALDIDASGLNTDIGNITNIMVGNQYVSSLRVDNFFIADDWQGELKSHLILPTADDVVEFTPSSGTDNYDLLQTNDGDTSYVSSDVVGEQDMYEFGPDLGMFEVHGVTIVTVARKDDVGSRSIQPVMEYGGVEYDLDAHVLGDSYPAEETEGLVQCMPEAPNAAAWDGGLINSMKAGFKVA
jgi:hypothetical protein